MKEKGDNKMLSSFAVPNEAMQTFVRNLEVRQAMSEYIELTEGLFDNSERVNPDGLMEVAFYALMAFSLLANDVFVEPELDEVKEKVTHFLGEALEGAGFETCP